MLDELKGLDTIGKRKDVLYFLQTAIGRHQLSRDDLKTICAYASGFYSLDVDVLLSFCQIFGFITIDTVIELNEAVLERIDDIVALDYYVTEKCISLSFENHVIKEDFFTYDIEEKMYSFRNEKLPLCWSFIRNLLIDFNFLSIKHTTRGIIYLVAPQYEQTIQKFCKLKKKTMSIKQLYRKLEQNIIIGEQAEQFVKDYEKRRISNETLKKQIKIISDIDVCAGYDIVSFNSDDSVEYDRFIEVKAVSVDFQFFWSTGEIEVARIKNQEYFLYLVEMSKIHLAEYHPVMISNPSSSLISSDEWLLEPQNYIVKHINPDLFTRAESDEHYIDLKLE